MLGVLPFNLNGNFFQDSLQEEVSNLNLILSKINSTKVVKVNHPTGHPRSVLTLLFPSLPAEGAGRDEDKETGETEAEEIEVEETDFRSLFNSILTPEKNEVCNLPDCSGHEKKYNKKAWITHK